VWRRPFNQRRKMTAFAAETMGRRCRRALSGVGIANDLLRAEEMGLEQFAR